MSESQSVAMGSTLPISPAVNIGTKDAQGPQAHSDRAPMPMVTAPHASYGPPQQKKPGSKLLVIGIILCVIALVALAAILYLVFARPFTAVNAPEPPQISEVEAIFQDSKIDTPKLEGFMYIKTEGLTGPELSEYKVGNVTEDSSAKGSFNCNGEAKAAFQNDYVNAIVPLTVKLTHAAESTSWVPGGVDEGSPEVSPTGPADVEGMQANIQNILKGYDADIANQFVDCEVKPEASLSTQGGTVVFNLSKTVGEETKTCAVNTDVTWGNTGWDVTVTGVTGLEETPTEEVPAEPEPIEQEPETNTNTNTNTGTNNGSTDRVPTMAVTCWSGDLLEVPGTIQVQANGSVLLRADDLIRVTFNEKIYIVDYFEIVGSGSFQNGQHTIVIGAISATGTNPIAPLVLNVNWS